MMMAHVICVRVRLMSQMVIFIIQYWKEVGAGMKFINIQFNLIWAYRFTLHTKQSLAAFQKLTHLLYLVRVCV